MIRRSLFVATIALVLSIFLHALGLLFSSENHASDGTGESEGEVVDVGGGFEDIAEAYEPVEPEAAETPDPPEAIQPEPVEADAVTSQALVASDNPQNVTAPDTGPSEVTEPDTAGLTEAEDTASLDSDEAEDTGGEPQTAAAATAEEVTNPEDALAETPKGDPDVTTEAVEAEVAEEPLEADQTEVALVELASIPDVPVELEALAPEVPEISVDQTNDVPQPVETEVVSVEPGAAVARSLRPPKERPQTLAQGTFDGSADANEVSSRPTEVIESPLTSFQKNGVDLIARGLGGTRTAGLGFAVSRGPGNATSTNYVGRVLVHLNRAPQRADAIRGSARVYFQINPDGSLAWVRVLNRSGTGDIDTAAKEQVRRAAPFPRPPRGEVQKLVFVYRNR
ncbi:MAG: energy transducer TonB [Pseudomonadota bacterium]